MQRIVDILLSQNLDRAQIMRYFTTKNNKERIGLANEDKKTKLENRYFQNEDRLDSTFLS